MGTGAGAGTGSCACRAQETTAVAKSEMMETGIFGELIVRSNAQVSQMETSAFGFSFPPTRDPP